MKQLFPGLMIAIVFVLAPVLVDAAGAATMSLDQSALDAQRGQLFDITVSVNGNGEELDTVRAVVTYDPAVLSAQNVQLVGVFDRSAPGNYTDNGSGKVSWGGFTLEGPITSSTEFITITFLALTEGVATISISGDSRAISNGEERIDLASLESASVTVGAAQKVEEGAALIVVTSSTHLNDVDWYALDAATFSWVELEGDSPISTYYWDFDQSSDTDPTTAVGASTTEVSVEGIEDGVHYFHIKGEQEDGTVTPTVHRRVNVDTTEPNPIELIAENDKILEGESVWLTFATTDEASGVSQYQLAINDSAFQVQTSPLKIDDLQTGTYFFRVAAFDRAGNVTYQGKSVRVYPLGTDLERAEGFEETSEIEGILEAMVGDDGSDEDGGASNNLLITLLLGAIITFGIIKAIIKRKK